MRQLDRQIGTQFYERTLLSRDKAAMLRKGQKAGPDDVLTPEEEIKDPFFLEFLDLKDEYSESDLEEALIRHLETFLLELGNDFTFVGRQRRLRIDDEWFRVEPNKILAAEYRMMLPSEEILAAELARSRKMLEERGERARGKRKKR